MVMYLQSASGLLVSLILLSFFFFFNHYTLYSGLDSLIILIESVEDD